MNESSITIRWEKNADGSTDISVSGDINYQTHFRACLKTIVNRSEFSESNNNSCDHEHFVGRFCRFLVIPAQPSEVFKPCKCSLHDPSFLRRDKLTRIIRMCNLYVNSKIMLGLLYEITAIASVGVIYALSKEMRRPALPPERMRIWNHEYWPD